MNSLDADTRCVSGMRPTGRLHLAHLKVLKHWERLQHEYQCFYFVADWHALTTGYLDTDDLEENAIEMVTDWLAAGLSPAYCTMFIQSQVPEHAELQLLLSMITPVATLERVPTYKEQIEQLTNTEIRTHGFLGYPVLQSADILAYQAGHVPVGKDQVKHVELTRDIARRFNHLFGKDKDFDSAISRAIDKLDSRTQELVNEKRRKYVEDGDREALEVAREMIADSAQLTRMERERVHGYLEGAGRLILAEPAAIEESTLPGLDGRKMSKSYGNTIRLREDPKTIETQISRMPTDVNRVKRTDPGDPSKCPVNALQKHYLTNEQLLANEEGCRTAAIGCLECKRPLIDNIMVEQEGHRERAAPYEEDPDLVRNILTEGADRARAVASETLDDVRSAMNLAYRNL